MLPYLKMCISRAKKPEEDYLERPEVRQLLDDLQRERPDNLNGWLRGYISKRDTVFTQDASYDMLDWRFFILNKEKEVTGISHKLTSSQAKKRQVGKTKYDAWEKEAHLYAYLPRIIKDSINAGLISFEDQQNVLNTTPLSCAYNPIIASFDAAVVFMDASGFTVLTETLARLPKGAEQIGACLNQFFGPIIEKVVKHGGDILKFSGDAIMIVWPIKDSRDDFMTEDELGRTLEATSTASTMATLAGHCEFSSPVQAVTAACKCCLEVQREVGQIGKTPVDGVTLTLHCGVGFGNLNLLQLGGLLDRWEYCAAGTAIEGATASEPLAKPTMTVLSPSVVEVLKLSDNKFTTARLGPEKRGNEGYCQLVDNTEVLLNGGSAPRRRSGSLLWEGHDNPGEKRYLDPTLVKRFIPETVRRAIRRAVHVSDTLDEAEMRRVAVIFLGIEGGIVQKETNDEDSVARWAAQTQLVMRHFQRSVYALEGSINKFVVDDKGMVLLVVFGLPPVTHFNDDPVRAVLTATRLCDTLHEEGMHGRAGVATGRCWCGVVGTDFRQEYTVLGDVVNLAARLMSKASRNTVLVEQATHDVCEKYLKFESLGECTVKGKVKQVNVFQFTGQLSSNWIVEDRHEESRLLSWAEWPVKARIYEALEAQLRHEEGPGGIVYVQGRQGSGKREAVVHIEGWAKSKNFSVLSGQNMNPTSTFAVPRLCWQEVFGRLLEEACLDPHWHVPMNSAKPATSAGIQLYRLVLAMLTAAGAEKELLHWAPLLSFVLPGINFGAKGVSALLERDEQRSSGPPRLALLCALLLESFTASNTVSQGTIVLVHIKRGSSVYHESYVHDDNIAHAVAELAVNRRTKANGRPLIFCIVSRHGQVDKWLPSQAEALHGLVQIEDLNRKATECFMGHLLKTDSGVDECLVDWVYDTCGGHVYAVVVLCNELERFKALHRSAQGRVELSAGAQLQDVPYPEKLLGIALQGFEQLDLSDQQLLKAAAVFCQEHSNGMITRKVFTPLALAGYAGIESESDVEAIEEKCLQLVDSRIFAEVPAGFRSSRSSSLGSVTTVSFEEPDIHCRHFRFVSELVLHVASTLILEVQKKKMLERADTASSRLSSQRKSCQSQRLDTMTEEGCESQNLDTMTEEGCG